MDDIRMSRLYLCIIGDIWMISGCHFCTDVTFVPMYYRRYMDDIRMSLLYLCIIGDIWMISGCHVCTYVL